MTAVAPPLLEVGALETRFSTDAGLVHAVDGLSFSVNRGDTLALVGESGCGKSVTALSILRLVPDPPGRVTGGEILFEGHDLLKLSGREMRRIRGGEISMIFQDPMTSLNPVLTVGDQISEAIRTHERCTHRSAWRRCVELLDLVRIPDPHRRVHDYPHRLSGGMRQRVMIAMAVACAPKLLIADEPTTALDVTIQAQVLGLLDRLKRELGMTVLLITHDLGVVAEWANRVVVMYAGNKAEEGPVDNLFEQPLHPYTEGLLEAIPHAGRLHYTKAPLHEISGTVPTLIAPAARCRFAERCAKAIDICHRQAPGPFRPATGREVSCFVAERDLA